MMVEAIMGSGDGAGNQRYGEWGIVGESWVWVLLGAIRCMGDCRGS